ncbi:MAG: YCF48-related protein [Ignavibacteriaceae bacterium]|nr:YCF48-related protein [Ignavibacteriaceae bacterium]
MKTWLVILLILFSYSISAQWTIQNPHPTPNNLYIGSAPSLNTYVTITDIGEFVKTTDGGATWKVSRIGGDGIYRSTFFLSDNLGWAAGALNGKFHRTTDGGTTWIPIVNAPDTTKYDIYFIDQNTGWSVGFNGFIIKTTDGGENWFSQTNTGVTSRTLYGVRAYGSQNVLVSGSTDALVRSTDGGTTWNLIPPVFSTATNYRGITYLPGTNGQTAFVVGDRNRIAKTTDGGATWTQAFQGTGTTQLWAVDFNSSGTGLASGESTTLFRTTDFGATWSQITLPPTGVSLSSVRFADNNTVYLTGGRGYFFKSTDAGATWQELGYRFTTGSLNSIGFSGNTGYVSGLAGFVAKSTDGGNTFTTLTTNFTQEIYELRVVTPDVVYGSAKQGNVIKTTDGGATWAATPTGLGTNIELVGMDAVNENFAVAVGTSGTVIRTNNGGATWTPVSIAGSTSLLWDVDFVDTLYGWACGTGQKIYRTTDGGASWTEQASYGGLGFYGISFINRSSGIASGTSGQTYYTFDGGDTWNLAATNPASTIWSVDYKITPQDTFALATGSSGYVYRSDDDGKNWVRYDRRTINTMEDVFILDASRAWAVGNGGVIVHFNDPSVIPVELTSFSASAGNGGIDLKWTTATETNNYGFEIERRISGDEQYQAAGFVRGNVNASELNTYIFTDKPDKAGSYTYRLKQTDLDGSFRYHNLGYEVDFTGSFSYRLGYNYPNPFNPVTTVNYSLGQHGPVKILLFSAAGELVKVLYNGIREAGNHILQIDGTALSSGVYFVSMEAGSFRETIKISLLK